MSINLDSLLANANPEGCNQYKMCPGVPEGGEMGELHYDKSEAEDGHRKDWPAVWGKRPEYSHDWSKHELGLVKANDDDDADDPADVTAAVRQGYQHGSHDQPPEDDPDDDADHHPTIGQGDRPLKTRRNTPMTVPASNRDDDDDDGDEDEDDDEEDMDEENCPHCGQRLRNGRCPGCGYRQTNNNLPPPGKGRPYKAPQAPQAVQAGSPQAQQATQQQAMQQQQAANRAACTCHGVPVANCPVGGRHMAGGPPFGGNHQASQRASQASMSHPPARAAAFQALDHSQDGNSAGAVKSHKQAASIHDKAATQARKDGDDDGAADHDQAASQHRQAASLHAARPMPSPKQAPAPAPTQGQAPSPGGDQGPPGQNARRTFNMSFDSLPRDAQRAAFAAMSDGGGSTTHAANVATRHARKTGTAGAHLKAAAAHRDAYDYHKNEGNDEYANHHKSMASSHTKKAHAARVNNRSNTMLTAEQRQGHISFIVTNCDCGSRTREDAAALLANYSDADLLRIKGRVVQGIVANARAEGTLAANAGGSFAGVKPDGATRKRMASKEDEEDEHLDDDLDNDDVDAEDAFTGNRGQAVRQLSEREFMQMAPPRIREMVNNQVRQTNQEKTVLARQIQLTANAEPDQRRRAFIINRLRNTPGLEGLRELYVLVAPPQVVSNEAGLDLGLEDGFPTFDGAGTPQLNLNAAGGDDDILEPPTVNWAAEAAANASK
jgi:hypothetical protein